MIVDLHVHYPMHVVPEQSGKPAELLGSQTARVRMLDHLRAGTVHWAGRLANYRSFHSGPRVTIPRMHAGGVRVGLSVLYSFWDEMDWPRGANTPPDERYFSRLVRQLEAVEAEIARRHPEEGAIARSPAELDGHLADGRTVLVHCLEGAFHLGREPDRIARNVSELADRGVAYVTIAHLFNRGVAEVANAIPFIPDVAWRVLFWQPREPLLEPARAAIRALVGERMLIDLCHMSEHAIDATLSLLDRLDPRGAVPVIASHAGYRFGRQDYMLCTRHVEAIARRGGLVGLIFARHQAEDGLRLAGRRDAGRSLEEVLFKHVDRIHEITGSHDHTAIGTDFDGFVKPTLSGFDDSGAMALVEQELATRYGAAAAEKIASGNALRLLRGYWRS